MIRDKNRIGLGTTWALVIGSFQSHSEWEVE